MKGINYLLLVGFTVVLLSACSKEKKIEKWLKKGVGEWQVKANNIKGYKNDTLFWDENFDYPMKFIFDENGNFLKVGYEDDAAEIVSNASIVSGKWTSTEDEILVQTEGGWMLKMKILDIERKKMKLEYTEGSSSEKYVHTLSLEKEK